MLLTFHWKSNGQRTWNLREQVFAYAHGIGWGRADVGDWKKKGPKYEHYCPRCWLEQMQLFLSRELESIERQLKGAQ